MGGDADMKENNPMSWSLSREGKDYATAMAALRDSGRYAGRLT